MSSGGILGVAILLLGGVVDYFVTEPFFVSLVAGTTFTGWSPLVVFLFLCGIPYAASVAAVAAAINAILGAS